MNRGIGRTRVSYYGVRRPPRRRWLPVVLTILGAVAVVLFFGLAIYSGEVQNNCIDRLVVASDDVRTAEYKCMRGLDQ